MIVIVKWAYFEHVGFDCNGAREADAPGACLPGISCVREGARHTTVESHVAYILDWSPNFQARCRTVEFHVAEILVFSPNLQALLF